MDSPDVTNTTYYAKGLGFWSDKYSSIFMNDMDTYTREYKSDELTSQALELAFDQDKADLRKDWINAYDSSKHHIDYRIPVISFTDFVNKELIHHSMYNIQRSITAIDGFKVS